MMFSSLVFRCGHVTILDAGKQEGNEFHCHAFPIMTSYVLSALAELGGHKLCGDHGSSVLKMAEMLLTQILDMELSPSLRSIIYHFVIHLGQLERYEHPGMLNEKNIYFYGI